MEMLRSYLLLPFASQEKILQPSFLSYKELLQLNIQEVMSRLSSSSSTTDPSYFRSLMEHLQSPSCTLADFRRIHMYFMVRIIDLYLIFYMSVVNSSWVHICHMTFFIFFLPYWYRYWFMRP